MSLTSQHGSSGSANSPDHGSGASSTSSRHQTRTTAEAVQSTLQSTFGQLGAVSRATLHAVLDAHGPRRPGLKVETMAIFTCALVTALLINNPAGANWLIHHLEVRAALSSNSSRVRVPFPPQY